MISFKVPESLTKSLFTYPKSAFNYTVTLTIKLIGFKVF